MKILGAKLIAVTRGTATLKDAVDSAFDEYLKDPKNFLQVINTTIQKLLEFADYMEEKK